MMRHLAIFALFVACAAPDRTRATLEAIGFTRITITGAEWMSCGRGENYCTGFDATAPSGRRVHGAVGCGAGCQGCAVRLDAGRTAGELDLEKRGDP